MGGDHCVWLADDGSVWTSGRNDYGQLGHGDHTDRNRPSRVPNLPPISSVQSGYYATLCLDVNGNLWSFGCNYHGQLGLGVPQTRASRSPKKVRGIPPVLSFCFQHCHSIFLCEGGYTWGFGSNLRGQLGLGHQTTQSAPVQLPSSCFSDQIISVSCGYHHSLFLTCEGQVFTCGRNDKGQLGQGDSTNRYTPTLIPNMNDCIQISSGGLVSCMVDSSHRLWVCGSHTGSQETPLCFPSIGLIKVISTGYQYTICINQSGELWGWGLPSNGELGNGSREPCTDPILLSNHKIEACLCIGYSSFIQEANGETFCCGKNNSGQLGLGNTNEKLFFSKFKVKREQYSIWSRLFYWNVPEEEEEESEPFRMRFPGAIRKFSQKSARSALPLPE